MPDATLITIRLSHYCEKARWALEHARVSFREDAHAPGFHMRAVKRAGGRRTTPVLVTSSGVLSDSSDILAYADREAPPERKLFPTDAQARREVLALEELYDEKLGPHARRYVYFHLLPESALALELMRSRVPTLERALLPVVFPLLRGVMRRSMQIDAAGARRSKAMVDEVIDGVNARLADGRRYLVGDRFSAADLTFAALAAPLVAPTGYAVELPSPKRLPPEIAEAMEAIRETPAGRFARRIYDEHRRA